MNKSLLYLERKLAAVLLRLLRRTLRFSVRGDQYKGKPCIYAFWHRNMIPLCLQRVDEGIVVLISSSKDGELVAGPSEELGYRTVRGSTTRGASQATREMLRILRDSQLALTPDGPKGPSKSVQQGVAYLALVAKVPIIPLQAELRGEWVFNSWDRFRFPKPFARVCIAYGEPIFVSGKEDMEPACIRLKIAMDKLEKELLEELS